jgi:hypothetical protein
MDQFWIRSSARSRAFHNGQMPKWIALRWRQQSKVDPALADTRMIVLTSMGYAFRSPELKQQEIEA